MKWVSFCLNLSKIPLAIKMETFATHSTLAVQCKGFMLERLNTDTSDKTDEPSVLSHVYVTLRLVVNSPFQIQTFTRKG